MSYIQRNGKLIKRERLKRREPQREPINMGYQHELWTPGPVQEMAWAIAKQQFFNDMRAKGVDPRTCSPGEIRNGIRLILFNTGEVYLNKAKEALR